MAAVATATVIVAIAEHQWPNPTYVTLTIVKGFRRFLRRRDPFTGCLGSSIPIVSSKRRRIPLFRLWLSSQTHRLVLIWATKYWYNVQFHCNRFQAY